MQILVKTMTGQTIALDLEPSDTSADVKEKIWFKESVPVRRQCLIFSGKELVGDNHIISDYITSDYNILHLVLRRSNAEYGHSIWEACAKGDLTACEYIYDVNANAADVVTKAVLEMDEEGTTAAAAAAVIMKTRSIPRPPLQLTFDRPFVMAVVHVPTGAPIFVARINEPGAGQ